MHDHDHAHQHGHHHHHHHDGADTGPTRFTDPATESLNQALRTGFNILRVIMLILLIAYAFSGVFKVNVGEQGVLVRFGKLMNYEGGEKEFAGKSIYPPGTHLALPDPFDTKVRISGAMPQLTINTFSFATNPDDAAKGKKYAELVPTFDKIQPGVTGTMLTGDRNLSHGQWTIEYRIEDAGRFVRNIGESRGDADALVQRLAEDAIVRTVAGLTVEMVTYRARADGQPPFTDVVAGRLNEELRTLDSGIVVNKVTAQTIEPGAVQRAFTDVTNAQSERERTISEARNAADRTLQTAAGAQAGELIKAIQEYGAAQSLGAEAARLETLRAAIDTKLAGAGGTVAQRLREAQSRANQILEKVQQEYATFVSFRERYERNPHELTTRLWTDMRSAVLGSKQNEFFFLPPAGAIEIRTNRDPLKAIEAETDRYKQANKP